MTISTPMSDTELHALHHDAPLVLGYMNAAMDCSPDGSIRFANWVNGSPYLQGSLPNLLAGGVDVAVVSFGLNEPDLFPGRAGVGRVVQQLGAFARELRPHADRVAITRTPAELQATLASGRLAIVLHLTGARLDGALEVLHAYADLGVRSIHTPFDDAGYAKSQAWQGDAGLTAFDREVLREMTALGMVVDLAHANERMAHEILDLVQGPAIISHTMCRGVTDTPRNSSDALHRAVAAAGGVIGIHFAGQLLDLDYARRRAASGFLEALRTWEADLRREFPDPFAFMAARLDYPRWVSTEAYRLQQSIEPPSIECVLDHVDHLIQTVGPDHVGIGSDYDLGNIPIALNRADKLPALTRGLASRGHDEASIRKVLGGNFLRLLT